MQTKTVTNEKMLLLQNPLKAMWISKILLSGSQGHNFVGSQLSLRQLKYFNKFVGHKFVGKGNPVKLRTLIPTNNNCSTVICIYNELSVISLNYSIKRYRAALARKPRQSPIHVTMETTCYHSWTRRLLPESEDEHA